MESIGKVYTESEMAEQYPGFPAFVHQIMAHVANGASAEEAAMMVDGENIRKQIDDLVTNASKRPDCICIDNE